MKVLQKWQQFQLKLLAYSTETQKYFNDYSVNFLIIPKSYTRYFSSNKIMYKNKHGTKLNISKSNQIFEINILKVLDNKPSYSLSTFKDNLLWFWYYDLNNFPKDYLTSALFNMINHGDSANDYLDVDFDFKESWDYSIYIYMFNKEGKIIGNIIEVNYNHGNYEYNLIVNIIYEVINNNASFSDRCFYIYITDHGDKIYNCLDMHESFFSIENLK